MNGVSLPSDDCPFLWPQAQEVGVDTKDEAADAAEQPQEETEEAWLGSVSKELT